jgi:hypothetical protein
MPLPACDVEWCGPVVRGLVPVASSSFHQQPHNVTMPFLACDEEWGHGLAPSHVDIGPVMQRSFASCEVVTKGRLEERRILSCRHLLFDFSICRNG